MTAATFVAGMVGGLLGLAIGWRVANKGTRLTVAYFLERLEAQDDELRDKDRQLANQDQTILTLEANQEAAFKAGWYHGQQLREEREEWGL
jgi:hypothetical protein